MIPKALWQPNQTKTPNNTKKDKTYEIYWPFVAIIGHSVSWTLILKRKRPSLNLFISNISLNLTVQ